MGNFKINSKKVLSGVVLSSIVLGNTFLSNASFSKVFAMQKAEENVEQNFIETDMFRFLLEHVTEEDISKYNILKWEAKLDPKVYYILTQLSLVELITLFKIAEIKLEEGNKNAETVQNCLKNIFSDQKLTKKKIRDYFGSHKSGGSSFDKNAAANVPLINACKLAYEKYKDIESSFANDDFPFFQSNSY